MQYICSNCGNVQNGNGQNFGCGTLFWIVLLCLNLVIGIFAPPALILVLFEILFIILCSNSDKVTHCRYCKSQGTVVPVNSPKGSELYDKYYECGDEEDE